MNQAEVGVFGWVSPYSDSSSFKKHSSSRPKDTLRKVTLRRSLDDRWIDRRTVGVVTPKW
jgi:hypothetical protein